MNVALLVPRRADRGHRDRLWQWSRRRWESILPGVPVVEGHHNEGLFNRSRAINTAAKHAGRWDVGVVIDSDIFIRKSQVEAAIETARSTGKVTWAHRRWRGLSETMTEKVVKARKPHDFGPEMDHDDMDLFVEKTTPLSWSCCIAIPRAVWDDMGGFDERFEGWGYEDMAFQSVICGLYGHERIAGDVYHLWHPRSEERIVKGQPAFTASKEYVQNGRLGRRYMVALRRDHNLSDRHDDLPMTDTERIRDIGNLMREDRDKFGPIAKGLGLPDWSGWWPTLEELVAGAKALEVPGWRKGRVTIPSLRGPDETTEAPGPKVTVIVRTGGEEETWEERSGYLRESLASLQQQLQGPVTQSVIYSDWSPRFLREVEAIGQEFGFYVVGPSEHVGYVESAKQLWRYITRRAQGDYVFLTEDDFLYRQPINLETMIEILQGNPFIRQLALLREAYYPREREDGILGWPASSFEPRDQMNGHGHLLHRNFWTMNPSLFSRKLVKSTSWPDSQVRNGKHIGSERIYGDVLLQDRNARFAFLGDGTPHVEHIGAVRAGSSY